MKLTINTLFILRCDLMRAMSFYDVIIRGSRFIVGKKFAFVKQCKRVKACPFKQFLFLFSYLFSICVVYREGKDSRCYGSRAIYFFYKNIEIQVICPFYSFFILYVFCTLMISSFKGN